MKKHIYAFAITLVFGLSFAYSVPAYADNFNDCRITGCPTGQTCSTAADPNNATCVLDTANTANTNGATINTPVANTANTNSPTFANFTPSSGLGGLVTWLQNVINGLIPLVFAIAFIVLIWGIFQYFILGGADEEKRDNGKKLIVYGIIGLAVMLSIWGLVNLIQSTFGLTSSTAPTLPGLPKPAPTTGT